ncbi:AAA family ATPase [Blautia producta]|uniref:Cytidylate kinase n=1 Tax=Blautia producta TaxID=33035 RepID=A0A4P6LXY0_9FIRM|nr:cytidylate kinase-like family protein [Blautia producta]QBE95767.1 Cytidylate kinase [Blautia producta]
MQEKMIITISRQFGSGGKEIGEILAEKMGVRCYDRQILYLAAEKMGDTDVDIESILESAYQTPDSSIGSMGAYGFEAVPYYNKMFREQAKAILKIADKGSAVFLGRCADAVLKDAPDCYSFFIYADEEFRGERAKTHYGSQSLKELEKENKTRERYYNYYTGQKWGDPQNYDLMINTSKISLDAAADLILDYIVKRKEV